jgi:hypothetical protein
VRVRAQTLARDALAAEVIELILAQAALEEGARVDARRRVALVEDLVAAPAGLAEAILAAEEVVEADLVEARRAGVRREVAADAFARRTIATAFQRMIRRIRSSSASSPGKKGSCSGLIVLM